MHRAQLPIRLHKDQLRSNGIIASWLLPKIKCKKGWHKYIERILEKIKLNLKTDRYLLLVSH